MREFAELSWPQVASLREGPRVPVLLLPLGAVEPHGPHAPLSTDLLISVGVCRRVAERFADDPQVQVLVLPPLPYGVTRCAAAFPGAVGLSAQTLQAVLVDVCTDLIHQGFHVVVVNNHFEPEQVSAIHAALDVLGETTGAVVGFVDLTRRHRARRLPEEFQRGSCHAGRYETSLVLAERPDLVDAHVLPSLPPVFVDLPRALAEGQRDFRAMGLSQAYCGAPAEATAEEGERTFAVLADLVEEAVRELVRGTGGRDRPSRRSG